MLALDLPSREEALQFLTPLQSDLTWVKIGLQLFTKYGPSFVQEVADLGYKIFLDLKLYDIPNTVASAIKSLSDLPIDFLTLHASGGVEMMEFAKRARDESNPRLKLLAVTVLTSFNHSGLAATGIDGSPDQQVQRLASLAIESEIDGLVCSALEIKLLRAFIPSAMRLVCPGIRPAGTSADEQKRIMTPKDAIVAGANYLVIGRPILQATDPQTFLQSINDEINLKL